MILVVAHATDRPGIDSLIAGALAEGLRTGLPLATFRLTSPGRAFNVSGCTEHVAAGGELQPNGMVWLERAGSRVVVLDKPPEAELPASALISVNPSVLSPALLDAFRLWANRHALWATVVEATTGFEIYIGSPSDGRRLMTRPLARDAYGRLPPIHPDEILPEVARAFQGITRRIPAPASSSTHLQPRIVIVGEGDHLLDVYPAVLASLGDAAEQVRMAPRISCVSPRGIAAGGWADLLKESDGLVLPGGSDMSQTEGQIAAATTALRLDVPTLGLCLGMQTMTTAFLRDHCGVAGADLEEANPEADTLSYIRLRDAHGAPVHYLGNRDIHIRPDTRLAALYKGLRAVERLNHRYHLNPALIQLLERRRLAVSAVTIDTAVAETIEARDHRFFVGVQGHPELSSRPDAAHPVLVGFLEAAALIRGSRGTRNPNASVEVEDVQAVAPAKL